MIILLIVLSVCVIVSFNHIRKLDERIEQLEYFLDNEFGSSL